MTQITLEITSKMVTVQRIIVVPVNKQLMKRLTPWKNRNIGLFVVMNRKQNRMRNTWRTMKAELGREKFEII
jgi:hypothetical protein